MIITMKKIARKAPEWLEKGSIYQINPRTFSSEGTINSITKELPFLKELGFDIIYICPIFEEDTSLENISNRQKASNTGNPKNPYRMNDYFFVDEEYGSSEDLKNLVDEVHRLDMKILFDVVYAHIGPNAQILKLHPEFAEQNNDGSFVYTEWHFPRLDFNCEGLREYLYCNMVYYISVFGIDGYRCDVGDLVPIDFWKEAIRRMKTINKDAVLINEGCNYDYMLTAFDASYCWTWSTKLREIFCKDLPAYELKLFSEQLSSQLPQNAKILRSIDTHDTVTDWVGRTETIATNDGMEQIEVINYLIDGIPMVYCGNELACEAKLSMFANRFYMGEFETTDRDNKHSASAVRRQEIFKRLNSMKKEFDILTNGKTQWLDSPSPENVIIFKRINSDEEIIFIGNAKNTTVEISTTDIGNTDNCILTNKKSEFNSKDVLQLLPYEYVVFRNIGN